MTLRGRIGAQSRGLINRGCCGVTATKIVRLRVIVSVSVPLQSGQCNAPSRCRTFCCPFTCVSILGICNGADIADFRKQPLGEVPPFQKPDEDALVEASAHLRNSLKPLDELLSESESGVDWRDYLDWSSLEAQAAAGQNLDVSVLLKLYRRFNANENGLEMYQFVTVRRALAAAIEVAVAATNDQAAETYTKRIQKLGDLVRKAAKDKTPKSLDGVGPLLARLVESR